MSEKPEPVAYFDLQKQVFYWARETIIDVPLTVALEPLPLYAAPPENEALRRDAERWRHWRDSHGFATIDHEGGRCFVTLVCDCADPDQAVAKRFAKEDSFEWLDEFTDAAMGEKR